MDMFIERLLASGYLKWRKAEVEARQQLSLWLRVTSASESSMRLAKEMAEVHCRSGDDWRWQAFEHGCFIPCPFRSSLGFPQTSPSRPRKPFIISLHGRLLRPNTPFPPDFLQILHALLYLSNKVIKGRTSLCHSTVLAAAMPMINASATTAMT